MSIFRIAACVLIIACGQQQKAGVERVPVTIAMADTAKNRPVFSVDMVDNAKDPVCGMPVKAGITDTVHYKKKVYGFCAEGCKNAFLSDKAKYAASTKMKKTPS